MVSGWFPAGIDVNKTLKNFSDSMSCEVRQDRPLAYDLEYQGFLQHGTLKLVLPELCVKVIGMTTSTEYKLTNGVFKKRKVRLCVIRNQQKDEIHYQQEERSASVMKAAEMRLFLAIAAKHHLNLFKSDAKQAFLNGDICEDKLCDCPTDWWLEHVPHGYALQSMKSMYGTRQAAQNGTC